MLALKSIDFLPWPQKGKSFHPSLFCLTAALENFRMVTLWTGNGFFMKFLIVCIDRHAWEASNVTEMYPIQNNQIIWAPDSTLSGIDWSQSDHYCGRGPALSLPPRSLSTKLDGTWKWYWGQSCQSRYCNTHHESSCPLTIYFCIIPFVCVYWCRVRSAVGRLSRNLISHKHETSRHTERDQVSRP